MKPKKAELKQLKREADRYFEKGNYTLAKKLELEYVQHKPNDVDAWNNAGLCAMFECQYNEAYTYFKRAIQLDPNSSIVWGNLAALAFHLEDMKMAMYYEEKMYSLSINPYTNVGEHEKIISYSFNADLTAYNRMLDKDPYDEGARINRGNLWRKLGEYEKAKRDYEEVVFISPKNGLAYYNLGCLIRDHYFDLKSAKMHLIDAYNYGQTKAYFRLFEIEKGFDYVGKLNDVISVMNPKDLEDDLPF